MSLKTSKSRVHLCLLVSMFVLSTLCFGQTSSPTALPYTMSTIGGLSPMAAVAGTQCPNLPTGVKSTDGYGDGCLAVNGIFGTAGRGGVVVDSFGNVFISDDVNKVVHMIDPTSGIMTKIAGGGTACSGKLDAAGDGCLAATQTVTSSQRGIGMDPYGNILLAGYGDNLIHVVCRAASPICTSAQIGYMELVAGCSTSTGSNGTSGVGLDNTIAKTTSAGTCSTSKGEVAAPRGAAADRYGNIYFADTNTSRTRVILGPLTSPTYFSGNNPLWAALGVYYPSLTTGYVYTVVNTGGTTTTSGGTATTLSQSCSVTTNSATYSGTALDTLGDGCPMEFSSVVASSGYTSGVAVDAAGNMLFTDPSHGLRVFFVQGWTSAAAAASAGATAGTAAAGVAMYNAIVANNPSVTPQAGFIYLLAGGGATAISTMPTLGTSTSITDTTTTKLTVSPQGNVYIGDGSKVLFFDINTGYVRTLFAGSVNVALGSYCNGSSGQTSLSAYSDGCPASQSSFANSGGLGVAVDGQGNLYLYDTGGSGGMLVRKVLAQGFASQSLGTSLTQTFQTHFPGTSSSTTPSTVAHSINSDMSYGSPSCTLNGDYSIDCTETVTTTPTAAGTRSASMTFTNTSTSESLTLNLGGTVTGSVLAIDGATSAGSSLLSTTPLLSGNTPAAIALDGEGNLYEATGTSIVESLAASSSSTQTLASGLSAAPTKIAVDQRGNIYYLNGSSTIQELVVSAAGSTGNTYSPATIAYTPNNLGTANPVAIAIDSAGNLLVADEQSSAGTVYKLSPSALATNSQAVCSYPATASTPAPPSLCQSTVSSVGAFGVVSALTVDASGNIYVADTTNSAIYELTPAASGYSQSTKLSSIVAEAIATDPAGDLYVQTASTTSAVVEYPLSGATSAGITVLGSVSTPAGLAVDGKGNLYSADASNTSVAQVQRGAITENFGSNTTTQFVATLTNVGNQTSTAQNSTTGAQASDFLLSGSSSNGCTFSNNLLGAMTAGQSCGMTATFPALGNTQETDYISFTATSPATSSLGILTLTGLGDTEAYTTTTTIGSASPALPIYAATGTEVSFPISVTASSTSTDGTITNNTVGPTTSNYVLVSVDSGAASTYYFSSANGLTASLTLNLSGLSAGSHSFTATFPLQGGFESSSAVSGTFTIGQMATITTWAPSAITQQVSAAIGTGVLDAAVSPGLSGYFVYTTTGSVSCTTTSANTIDASTYLPLGSYTLYATFCPTDLTDYAPSATSISYTVTQATTTVAVGASTNVVAADGSANYTSLSAALAALPTTGGTIYLAPGTYPGQNAISYPNVSLRGLGGDPTKVILTAEDGAFSSPFVYPGSGPGNANASGDQGSSTLDVAKSAYIGNQATAGNVSYTPNGFYAEYLTVQNTYNTSTTTTSTYSTAGGSCADTGVSHTLQYLYNSGYQCNSQALAMWITADQSILNNVNLTSQQDTLYSGSQGCGSTCTAARQYMWKGMITGNVDYVFGDSALVFDRTNFFTTWHGTSAGGTETIEAQNKKYQTGSSNDYLSGYICNSCILLSQSTGMTNLYYGRPYGSYSTWIMLNSYVDQVNPVGWIEFSGDTNLPTSTYAEYNTHTYTDPAVGTYPYPASLFGGTLTPTGGNTGAGVTGTRETISTDPGTIEASNTIRTSLTAAQAAQYYPVAFLATTVPTQSYSGFKTNWNPVSALATKVNAFVPTTSVGTLPLGSSVTILGRPLTPGAGVIPTGTYAFYDSLGTNQVCSAPSANCATLASGNLDASGEAYLTTSSLAGGMHYITMVYGGDTNFTGGTSSVYSVYVLPAGKTATTTTLSVNNLSSTTGAVVTGSSSVSPSAATGTVSLVLDGTTINSCTLTNGSCSWSLSGISTGMHTLYASYSGDSSYGLSSSSSATLEVLTPAATGDIRTVTEPSFPTVCQQLTATLATDPAIQDLDASVDATNTNIDGARIQAALNSCSATAVAANTNLAVELSMDSTGNNAFLTGPLSMPSNVTLLVDPAVTLYFSRNVQDYDKVSGVHTCGTINSASNTGSCLPLIEILKTSTNVGIMGYGKLNGRGGDLLINAFATAGYAPPSTYTWWNLASQANGEGNQQNPRFIQMDSGSSNITLYKITVLNSPNFHISTTGPVTNFTAWDVKVITPTSARNTDGIDPGNMQNATITRSWVSEGDDNIAVGAPNTVAAKNISVTNNHFFAGHGESIGSYTGAGVSNILFDGNMSAGNAWAGYGSASVTGVADTNSTAIHIKTSNDRGGLVTGIQYSNSCFLDHKTDIQITPYYSSGDSTTLFPNFTNILLQNLVFMNDASSQGSVELTGEYNSNSTGGGAIINPLGITLDNVTFPSSLSSLVNSTTPVESASVWGTGNYSGGTGQYVNLTVGAGQVSSNFLTAYTALVNNSANSDTLTNNIVQSSLNPPNCIFTYLAPELTGPTGQPQTITYGNTASLVVILTPAVGGAAYPNGTVTLTDSLTGNTFTGTFNGTGDTIAVTIPSSDFAVGTHTFSATSYSGDTHYTVPAAYQTFGSYVVTVNQATPTISAWPSASAITYGQTLASSTLSGGTTSVPGTFAFSTPSTAPNIGTSAQSVAFTPNDTTDYTTVSGTVNVTVNQATPTISAWPTASSITYGQALASSTLSGGTASVAGTFAFTTPTSTPNAGTSAQSITFTPNDTSDYTTVSGSVNVTVNKATPTVTAWPTASTITYGQTLASSTLSGGTPSVPGTFAFTTPSTAPNVGASAQSVTFTPTDSTDYTSVSGTVNVIVNQATPTVSTWPTATSIIYGQTLSSSVLSGGTASVQGTFAFTAPTTIPPIGTSLQSVTFTPSSSNYSSISGTVSVTVNKVTPSISWNPPSTIVTGTNLSGVLTASSVNGTVTVPGTFVYTATPAHGAVRTITGSTILGAGTYTLTASFTPTDTTIYNAATGTASLTVTRAKPSISLVTSVNPALAANTVAFTATVSSSASTPSGSISFYDGSTLLATLTLSQGTAAYGTAALAAGTHSITAVYAGDDNFTSVTSAAISEAVEDIQIGSSGSGSGSAGSGAGNSGSNNSSTSQTVAPGGTATYALTLAPVNGTTFPAAITLSLSGLPVGATGIISPETLPAGSSLTNVTITIQLPKTTAELHPADSLHRKFAPMLLGVLLLPFTVRMRRSANRLGRMACLLILALAGTGLLTGLSGCGASTGYFAQQQKSYIVTITATSGTVSRSTNVTLTVQ